MASPSKSPGIDVVPAVATSTPPSKDQAPPALSPSSTALVPSEEPIEAASIVAAVPGDDLNPIDIKIKPNVKEIIKMVGSKGNPCTRRSKRRRGYGPDLAPSSPSILAKAKCAKHSGTPSEFEVTVKDTQTNLSDDDYESGKDVEEDLDYPHAAVKRTKYGDQYVFVQRPPAHAPIPAGSSVLKAPLPDVFVDIPTFTDPPTAEQSASAPQADATEDESSDTFWQIDAYQFEKEPGSLTAIDSDELHPISQLIE